MDHGIHTFPSRIDIRETGNDLSVILQVDMDVSRLDVDFGSGRGYNVD